MTALARRLQHAAYGGPEVLELAEVPLPEPGPGQVRVRIHAAGANALDSKKRRGLFAPGQEAPAEPQPLGLEMAGVIDALGPGVTQWSTGRPVLGLTARQDAVATHALADAGNIVAKPDILTFEQAAALPVATETAYRTLRRLGVVAGQTLLVHAAAGGVGLMAVQLARALGATVIGTAGEANHPFLRDLGATPVTYGDGLAERIRAAAPQGIDAVLDASGRGVLPLSVELTGSPDKVLTIADLDAARHGVRFSREMLPIPQVMDDVLPMIEDGRLQLPLEAVFPLEKAADAYHRLDEGHLRGKIVLTVRTPSTRRRGPGRNPLVTGPAAPPGPSPTHPPGSGPPLHRNRASAAVTVQDAAGGCQPAVLADFRLVQAAGVLLDQTALDTGLGRCPHRHQLRRLLTRHVFASGGAFGRRGLGRLPALAAGGGKGVRVVEAGLRHAGVPSAQGVAYRGGTPGSFQGGAGQLVEGSVVGWSGVADELVLGGLAAAALAGGAVGRALHLGRKRLALVPGTVAPYHRRRVGARVVPVKDGCRLVGSVASEVGRLGVLGVHRRQRLPLHAPAVHAPAHEDVLCVFHDVVLGHGRGVGVQRQPELPGLPGHG